MGLAATKDGFETSAEAGFGDPTLLSREMGTGTWYHTKGMRVILYLVWIEWRGPARASLAGESKKPYAGEHDRRVKIR